MNITIATLFPDLYDSFLKNGIIGKGKNANLFSINFINMLQLCPVKTRVDSPIVGHGSGMLLGVDIIQKVYEKAEVESSEKPYVIFFSPHGKVIDQTELKILFEKVKDRNLLLFSGRYEGFDVRAEEEYADDIYSIGNYVLMGGDLPIMVFLESFLRLVPNVIGKKDSVENDSFQGPYVDNPHFASPQVWKNKEIPEILKSGNHYEIKKWRLFQAMKITLINHFNWWRKWNIPINERKEAKKVIPSHYCALLHNDVVMPDGRVGESSVTSIDIHDIARSSATYGIKKYFVVTRLEPQRKLVDIFLEFWHNGDGKEANKNRSFALGNVKSCCEIEDVIDEIAKEEGKSPICIVTSSRREIQHDRMINYCDQKKIWELGRPILFIFGTAHGISKDIMDKFDYRLIPLEGLEEFNFLSVRSAAAIIFDRWLGMNQVY
jgi:tRNA (guanine37-N1)-methyltransferase